MSGGEESDHVYDANVLKCPPPRLAAASCLPSFRPYHHHPRRRRGVRLRHSRLISHIVDFQGSTMTAEVHYQYMRTQPAAPSRRQPFSNTGNQLPAVQATIQDAPVKPPKPPSSPPLPRQNTKTAPPSPPQLIYDKDHSVSYSRVGFLGEVRFDLLHGDGETLLTRLKGGFARVYEAVSKGGSRHAIKVVTKTSLKTTKAKTKVRPGPDKAFLLL